MNCVVINYKLFSKFMKTLSQIFFQRLVNTFDDIWSISLALPNISLILDRRLIAESFYVHLTI